jgi:4-amino-4-deoxy-L-arabinose transferase-like glycosyltransferase
MIRRPGPSPAGLSGSILAVSPRPKTQSRAARPAARSAPPVRPTPSTAWMERVRPAHAALALALLHLALVLLSLNPSPHNGGDNASYLALATSLREHGTYQELWDPAARPHTQYPPGWPMILAAALAAGIKPWVGFKVLSALFSALAVGLAYLWARRLSTAGTALAMGALLAVGPGVVDDGRWELSDAPFWAFTMLALWAFARLQRDGSVDAGAPAPVDVPAVTADEPRWKSLLGPVALAGVATLLAYATRSAGLPLVVAAVGWLAWRRRWAQLGVFAAVVAPFAVYWWARGRAAGGPSYAGYLWYVDPYRPVLGTLSLGGMVGRLAGNGVEYTVEWLPYLLTGVRRGLPAAALGTAVVLLALAGWGMRVRRAGVPELWLPLYIGLVLIWPEEWAAERFLLPALPMILLCAAEPVRRLNVKAGRATLVGAAAVGVIALAALPPLGKQIGHAVKCRAAYGPSNLFPCLAEPWADLLEIGRSLRGELPDGSTVLSRKATLFWAYSGYPSRTYPFTDNPDTLLAAARDARSRYILLDYMDQVSVMYLAPVLMQRPQAFCVMRAIGPGRATLMAIQPGAERMPNVRARPGNETADVPFPHCGPEFWAPGKAPPPPG